ncbi:hypothetical protein EYF80_031161 [Liparis tanakae]|uniref:Uncharacterized protein n=1 Tax=Liparis tanakae TaxID=230148 RepID=A0A4Z2GYH1_9TELE|nr:hypothetical protein EYF80_031161 [Liparis tanakae]
MLSLHKEYINIIINQAVVQGAPLSSSFHPQPSSSSALFQIHSSSSCTSPKSSRVATEAVQLPSHRHQAFGQRLGPLYIQFFKRQSESEFFFRHQIYKLLQMLGKQLHCVHSERTYAPGRHYGNGSPPETRSRKRPIMPKYTSTEISGQRQELLANN